jgi:RNA polymerase sigma-70 factor (ECF subfamily)
MADDVRLAEDEPGEARKIKTMASWWRAAGENREESPMSTSPPSLHTEQLARLLERVRQGDRIAADELIRRAGDRLVRMARQMLRGFPVVRGQEQTGDVVQAATLRLLAALREATPGDTRAFYALASQHIRYHLLDLARRYKRGVPRPLEEHPAPVVSDQAEVADLERWHLLHEAVEGLPLEQREVFGLRFYHGWTWERIAELLQVNERTARRWWLEAGVALERALGGQVPGRGV